MAQAKNKKKSVKKAAPTTVANKKQAKAKKYMEETAVLSNYWRFSDLEA